MSSSRKCRLLGGCSKDVTRRLRSFCRQMCCASVEQHTICRCTYKQCKIFVVLPVASLEVIRNSLIRYYWLTANEAVLEASGSDVWSHYCRSTRQTQRAAVVRLVSAQWTLLTRSQTIHRVCTWPACNYKHTIYDHYWYAQPLCCVNNRSNKVLRQKGLWRVSKEQENHAIAKMTARCAQ